MKNSWHKKLDDILFFLLKEKEKGFIDKDELVKVLNNITDSELVIMLDFLVSYEFLLIDYCSIDAGAPILSMPKYKLSLKGHLFLENNSFTKLIRSQTLKRIWTILKIIIVMLNAIAILSLWSLNVWASFDIKENKQKDKTIDSLNLELSKIKPPMPIK